MLYFCVNNKHESAAAPSRSKTMPADNRNKIGITSFFRAAALFFALILLASTFAATSCAKSEPAEPAESFERGEIDVASLAQALCDGLTFDDEPVKLADSIVALKYTALAGAECSAVYAGSGATAEEIIVAGAADENGATALLSALEGYNKDRREIYADYNPAEAARLSSPLLIKKGKYVIYCVAADLSEADAIISSAFSA